MHKRFYLTIAIVLTGIVALQFFKAGDPAIKETQVPDYFVVGYEYYGLAKDERVKNSLEEIDALLKDKKLSGNLGVWYFGNPDQIVDSMTVIIGAFSTDSLVNQSTVLIKKKIKGGKVVRAEIDPFTVFAPTPEDVTEQLLRYGKEKGLGEQIVMYAEKYVLDTASKPKVWNEIMLK